MKKLLLILILASCNLDFSNQNAITGAKVDFDSVSPLIEKLDGTIWAYKRSNGYQYMFFRNNSFAITTDTVFPPSKMPYASEYVYLNQINSGGLDERTEGIYVDTGPDYYGFKLMSDKELMSFESSSLSIINASMNENAGKTWVVSE